jgi:hypothetical protein
MLIRSQDKTELINLSNIIRISVECKSVTVEAINEIPRTIGYYSSWEKALKVLDKIENTYVRFQQRYGSSTSNMDCVFVMPQEDEI